MTIDQLKAYKRKAKAQRDNWKERYLNAAFVLKAVAEIVETRNSRMDAESLNRIDTWTRAWKVELTHAPTQPRPVGERINERMKL